MNEHFWSALALVATLSIESAYIPQLVRLQRVKDAKAISLFFPALNVVGRIMAIAYMAHQGENIFALGISMGATLRGAFLCQVAYYKWRQRRIERLRERTVQI